MSLWNNHKIGMKRISAGAIIFDPSGKVLLIKSRLRRTWEWPAGRGEGNESPLQTCQREVREETGLDIADYRFLGVNFQDGGGTKNGRLNFTFVADIDELQAAAVSPQATEVSDYQWVDLIDAQKIIAPRLRTRFAHLLSAYEQQTAVYLEDGKTI